MTRDVFAAVDFEEKTDDSPILDDRKTRSLGSVTSFIMQQAASERNRKVDYAVLPELQKAKISWAAFDDKKFAKTQNKSKKIKAANEALDAIEAQVNSDVVFRGLDLSAFKKGGIFRKYLNANVERDDFPIFMSDFIHYTLQLADPSLALEEKKTRLLEFPIKAELNCFEGTRERLNLSLQKLALRGLNYEEQKLLRAHSEVIEKARQDFFLHVYEGNQIHLVSSIAWLAGFEDPHLHFNKTTSFEVPADKAWRFSCNYIKALNAELESIRKGDIEEFGIYRNRNLSVSDVEDLELLLKAKDLEGDFVTYNAQAYLSEYNEENLLRLLQERGISEVYYLGIRQSLMNTNSEDLSDKLEQYRLTTQDLENRNVLIQNPEYGKGRFIDDKIDQIPALLINDSIDHNLLPTGLFDADAAQKISHLVHSRDANLQKIALKALLMMGREVQSGNSVIQFFSCLNAISAIDASQIISAPEKFLQYFAATDELRENAAVVVATIKEQKARYPQYMQLLSNPAAIEKKDLVLEMLRGNANFVQIRDHIANLDEKDLRKVIKRFAVELSSKEKINFCFNSHRFEILDILFRLGVQVDELSTGKALGDAALVSGDFEMLKYIKNGFSRAVTEEDSKERASDKFFGSKIIKAILANKGISKFCNAFGVEKLSEIVSGEDLFEILDNEPKSRNYNSDATLVQIAKSGNSKAFAALIKLISADGQRDISEFVNKEIAEGRTLVHFVARYGTTEMINSLNGVGADFSKKYSMNGAGEFRAAHAASMGNISTAEALEKIDPKLFVVKTFDSFAYRAPDFMPSKRSTSADKIEEANRFNGRIKSYQKIYNIAHQLTSKIRESFGEKLTTLLGAESKAAIGEVEDKIFDFILEKFGTNHEQAALKLGYSNTKIKGVVFNGPLFAEIFRKVRDCVLCEPRPYCCGMMTKFEYATQNLDDLTNPLLPIAQVSAPRPSDFSERKEEEKKVRSEFAPNKMIYSPRSNKVVPISLAKDSLTH